MKRILLGLTLLFFWTVNTNSQEEEGYCYDKRVYHIHKLGHRFPHYSTNYEAMPNCPNRIPKSVYDRIDKENDNWFEKGAIKDPDAGLFSNAPLRNNPNFIKQKNQAIENIYNQSKAEIDEYSKIVELDKQKKQSLKAEAEKNKLEKEKQIKLAELEKLYSGKCNIGNVKGSEKYINCLIEKDSKDLAVRKKAEIEAKQNADRLAKMSSDDRRAYNCSEKFGFRKGTDKFKDCVFKIYQAEVELEKLELQKELMKANIELAKANSQRQDSLALAQTEAAKMQALAARQQAIAAETGKNLALLDLSARLLAPPAAPQMNRTTCTFNGRFMNCF